MKKYFMFILAAVFLSVCIVGCSKDDSKPKTEEETNETVKASLIGKWQTVDIKIAQEQDGKFVKITDEEMLQEYRNELPNFTEVTPDKFTMFWDPGAKNDPEQIMEMTYTLDAKTNTIILTEAPRSDGGEQTITYAKYELSEDKKNVTLIIEFNNED